MAKTQTMYMHTLDGKPADVRWLRGPIVTPLGPRSAAPLCGSLDEIRRVQRASMRTYADPRVIRFFGTSDIYGTPDRYGYVKVEVPR